MPNSARRFPHKNRSVRFFMASDFGSSARVEVVESIERPPGDRHAAGRIVAGGRSNFEPPCVSLSRLTKLDVRLESLTYSPCPIRRSSPLSTRRRRGPRRAGDAHLAGDGPDRAGRRCAGSSMAPTLSGPHRVYRCDACQLEFAVGLDQLANDSAESCPRCGAWASASGAGTIRGDRLLIDRTAFACRGPRRWEVVVFRSPEDTRQLCVKRVVGLPGETVALVGGDVLINGNPSPGRATSTTTSATAITAELGEGWQLGPGEYFVLGDNAAISDDSRSWLHRPRPGRKTAGWQAAGRSLAVESTVPPGASLRFPQPELRLYSPSRGEQLTDGQRCRTIGNQIIRTKH